MTKGSAETRTYHPWTTYMWASEEARRRGDRRAGTDHLLLGLLQEPEIEAVLGVSLPEARDRLGRIDREALDALGIAQGIDAPPLRMHPVPKKPTIKAVLQDRNSDDSSREASTSGCGKAHPTRQAYRC